MKPLVRRLEPGDDIGAITDLLHRAYSGLGSLGLNYTAVDQDLEVTRQRLAEGEAFVAVLDGAIVGTVVVCPPGHEDIHPWLARGDACHLCQFAVDPGVQGQGVGRALAVACEAQGSAWGCEWIVLDTAEPAVHLVSLYEGWGFAVVGDFQYLGKSYRSVVMAKQLSTDR